MTVSVEELEDCLLSIRSRCEQLQMHLSNDITLFQNNAITDIEKSNQAKKNLIDEISDLTTNFHRNNRKNDNTSFMQYISNLIHSLDHYQNKRLKQLVSDVENQMKSTFESLSINEKYINTNTSYIQSIWAELMKKSKESQGLYNKKGEGSF